MIQVFSKFRAVPTSDFLKGALSGVGAVLPFVVLAAFFSFRKAKESRRLSEEHMAEMRRRFKDLRAEEKAREKKQNKIFVIVVVVLFITAVIPLVTVAANF